MNVTGPFPLKLHEMLQAVEDARLDHIIGWLPSGDEFAVHKPKEFTSMIMPRFFNQSKYKSFQRQLNLYQFHRRREGSTLGVYSHPLFRRNQPILSLKIHRMPQSRCECSSETSTTKNVMIEGKIGVPQLSLDLVPTAINSSFAIIDRCDCMSESAFQGWDKKYRSCKEEITLDRKKEYCARLFFPPLLQAECKKEVGDDEISMGSIELMPDGFEDLMYESIETIWIE